MSATEIIEQIKVLPKNEFAQVVEFMHSLERKTRATASEMADAELLEAARRTGSFALLEASGEDI